METEAEPEAEAERAGVSGDEESDTSTVSLAIGKRKDLGSYSFHADEEEVEFFRDHECLYNKGSSNYTNTQHKNRLLGEMAKDLHCEGENN